MHLPAPTLIDRAIVDELEALGPAVDAPCADDEDHAARPNSERSRQHRKCNTTRRHGQMQSSYKKCLTLAVALFAAAFVLIHARDAKADTTGEIQFRGGEGFCSGSGCLHFPPIYYQLCLDSESSPGFLLQNQCSGAASQLFTVTLDGVRGINDQFTLTQVISGITYYVSNSTSDGEAYLAQGLGSGGAPNSDQLWIYANGTLSSVGQNGYCLQSSGTGWGNIAVISNGCSDSNNQYITWLTTPIPSSETGTVFFDGWNEGAQTATGYCLTENSGGAYFTTCQNSNASQQWTLDDQNNICFWNGSYQCLCETSSHTLTWELPEAQAAAGISTPPAPTTERNC